MNIYLFFCHQVHFWRRSNLSFFTPYYSRAAVVRGQVVTESGMGLIGVRVSTTLPNEGFTMTRDNGWFDLMVNGGGPVMLQFGRNPYPPLRFVQKRFKTENPLRCRTYYRQINFHFIFRVLEVYKCTHIHIIDLLNI